MDKIVKQYKAVLSSGGEKEHFVRDVYMGLPKGTLRKLLYKISAALNSVCLEMNK